MKKIEAEKEISKFILHNWNKFRVRREDRKQMTADAFAKALLNFVQEIGMRPPPKDGRIVYTNKDMFHGIQATLSSMMWEEEELVEEKND